MRQRTISDFFWRDPSISDLSQEDKATLLYFLTSPSSNIIGCYQIVWMIAAAEMGWTKDQLLVVAKRLKEKNLIEFNNDGWIWVKIWWKHNSPGVALNPNSKLISHAKKQCAVVPTDWLIAFGKSLEAVGVDTLAIGYPYPQKAPSYAPSNPSSDGASDAPFAASSDAPYEKNETQLNQGLDAPSDGASYAAGDGRRGNRYLVSSKTTTPNPSLENLDEGQAGSTGNLPLALLDTENQSPQTVVVSGVIFPPETLQTELESIRAVLASSGVHQAQWQVIIDELTGARVQYTVRSPVGFVRELAQRTLTGTFIPEYGIAVAQARKSRELYAKNQALQEKAEKRVWAQNEVDLEVALTKVPPRLRAMMEKHLAAAADKNKASQA